MTFPDALKRFRNEYGLTQKDVASALGIQESAYRRYELGRTAPSVCVLAKIADAYDVSADYLLGRTDNPNLHVFETEPETTEDFLDKVILQSRVEHNAKLANAKGKVNAEMEYADTLLRNYHKLMHEKGETKT